MREIIKVLLTCGLYKLGRNRTADSNTISDTHDDKRSESKTTFSKKNLLTRQNLRELSDQIEKDKTHMPSENLVENKDEAHGDKRLVLKKTRLRRIKPLGRLKELVVELSPNSEHKM